MQITCKYDLVFNPQKTHVKAQAVNFFGCLYNANGVHPDPGKVNAIQALPVPTNVTELQEFLGLVMYLSPFIPGLSYLTAPLCELLKKDTDFTWNCTFDAILKHVKEAVISNTTLRYFNPSLAVTIQVNASQVSLGAALLQMANPWLLPARPHPETECWYTNIERDVSCCLWSREIPNMPAVGLSPLSQTTSTWNPSPRRTLQTHQPICSACYCTSRATITPSVTAPVRKWPCLTHSLSSVNILDLTSHWTLPSTMLACP